MVQIRRVRFQAGPSKSPERSSDSEENPVRRRGLPRRSSIIGLRREKGTSGGTGGGGLGAGHGENRGRTVAPNRSFRRKS